MATHLQMLRRSATSLAGFAAGAASLTTALVTSSSTPQCAPGQDTAQLLRSRTFSIPATKVIEAPEVPQILPQIFDNPMLARSHISTFAMGDDERTLVPPLLLDSPERPHADREDTYYASPRAGPRAKLAFEPKEVKAAIVTCGGLCPGLSTVVQKIVHTLHYTYGVPTSQIFGVPMGYEVH